MDLVRITLAVTFLVAPVAFWALLVAWSPPAMRRRLVLWSIVGPVAVWLPLVAMQATCEKSEVAVGANALLLMGMGMLFVCLLLGIPLLLLAIPRGWRPKSRPTLVMFVAFAATSGPSVWLAGRLRMAEFEAATVRAEPLVRAIAEHERANRAPPADLEPFAIPPGLPSFRLVTGEDARRYYHGNPWALVASAGGMFSFDVFYYVPDGNYPTRAFGGVIQRIGTWAYVHE